MKRCRLDPVRDWQSRVLLALSLVAAAITPHASYGSPAQDAREHDLSLWAECTASPTGSCLFTEADRIASSLPDRSLRARTLADMAAAYGNASIENAKPIARDTLRRAREIAPAPIFWTLSLARTWGAIAKAEVRLGNLDEALAIASGIGDAHLRNETFRAIARTQAANDDVVGALLTAARIDDGCGSFSSAVQRGPWGVLQTAWHELLDESKAG